MKTSFSLFFLSFLLFFVSPLVSYGQTILPGIESQSQQTVEAYPDQIYPMPMPPPAYFSGQDHFYSVMFRGNGEAVVAAKLIFFNTDEETDLSTFSLRLSSIYTNDIVIYQVIRERQCFSYRPLPLESRQPQPPIQECEQYQKPDYFQYWDGISKYQKANFELRGDTLEISLPQPVKPNNSGSFILYYRAFGYAKKNVFGAYQFNFETAKVEDKIRSLQVGISTDPNLFLRGVKEKVNYFLDDSYTSLKEAEAAPIAIPQLDSYHIQIGQGEIVKNAGNLQPLDSYSVKGSYADSRLKLYVREIVSGIGVAFVILVAIIFAIKKTVKVLAIRQDAKKYHNFYPVLGLSFIASFLSLVYAIVLFFLTRAINSIYFPNLYQFNQVLLVFVIIFSVLILSLFLFGPAILAGAKMGWSWGVVTLIFTVLWLVFFFFIALLVFFIFYSGQNQPIGPFLRSEDPPAYQPGQAQ